MSEDDTPGPPPQPSTPPKPGRAPWSGLDIAAVILMVLVLALIVGVFLANLGETAF